MVPNSPASPLLTFSLPSLRAPLLEPQEARYAEVPREMLLQNEWVVPLLHGKPYLDKPPLTYWAVMGLYQIFGIHDWAARLLPCFAGLSSVFVLVFWGINARAHWEGLIAGFILCLTNRFIYLERMLAPDTLLCLWVTLGLCLGFLACNQKKLNLFYWLGFGICMGLGILTKGPVAIILLALPIEKKVNMTNPVNKPNPAKDPKYCLLVFG